MYVLIISELIYLEYIDILFHRVIIEQNYVDIAIFKKFKFIFFNHRYLAEDI